MKAENLKALMNLCHDKTDLPTRAMLFAGGEVIRTRGWENFDELAGKVFCAMLDAARQDATVQPRDYVVEE